MHGMSTRKKSDSNLPLIFEFLRLLSIAPLLDEFVIRPGVIFKAVHLFPDFPVDEVAAVVGQPFPMTAAAYTLGGEGGKVVQVLMSFDFADAAHVGFILSALEDQKACAKVVGAFFFQWMSQGEGVCWSDMEMVDVAAFQRQDHVGVVQGVKSVETVLRGGRKFGNNGREQPFAIQNFHDVTYMEANGIGIPAFKLIDKIIVLKTFIYRLPVFVVASDADGGGIIPTFAVHGKFKDKKGIGIFIFICHPHCGNRPVQRRIVSQDVVTGISGQIVFRFKNPYRFEAEDGVAPWLIIKAPVQGHRLFF